MGEDTVSEWLRQAEQRLTQAGIEAPRLDARLLLAESLGIEPAMLSARRDSTVPQEAAERFEAWLSRRAAREPVYRILGYRPFYEHDFLLSPETLEPRSDTEILVDVARRCIAEFLAGSGRCRFCDVGTGTGAIAVSLLALFPAASAVAVDISADALATAARNGERAGVADRLTLRHSDYLAAVDGPLELIVSNPPYIPTRELHGLEPEVTRHDPRAALDGGEDGLDAYRAIATGAGRVLGRGGRIVVEIGFGQREDVTRIFAAAGYRFVGVTRDLGDVERVLCFTS